MSPKKEYLLILFISIGIPLFSYAVADSYFKNRTTQEPFIQEVYATTKKILKIEEQKPISLLFVGDIMLDRTIRKDGEALGYTKLFSCVQEEFKKHDAVIGNLEGTVTNFKSVSRDASYQSPESFRFTFDPLAVKALRDIELSIVSLGNNHIRDFGDAGIQQTLVNLNTLKIDSFGDPRATSQHYLLKTIGNTRIAFIVYNEFFGNEKQTLEDLKNVQSISDIQIIFVHWGSEYVPARADTKNLAHKFVDQGADVIIGAHPHVIQENETYKNVPIYYSLGNFIFDQYWEDAVREGEAVVLIIKDKHVISEKKLQTLSTRHEGTCFKKSPSPEAKGT